MIVSRNARLALLGGLAAVLTWLVSEPLAGSVNRDGTRVGAALISLGSPYGWFAHAVLGATVVCVIALSISMERMRSNQAALWGLAGFLVGGLFGWISDLAAEHYVVQFAGHNILSSFVARLVWRLAVVMSLAVALAVCTQPTPSRFMRTMVAGLVASVASAAIAVVFPLSATSSFVNHSDAWFPFNLSRLFDHLLVGSMLGLSVSLMEAFLSPARLRVVFGRSEARDFVLGDSINRIGSEEGLEVSLPDDPTVGPVHAQIVRRDGLWFLQDCGGPGGTMVNGQRVKEVALSGFEVVTVGEVQMRFLIRGQSAAPPSPATNPSPDPSSNRTRVPTVTHRLIDPFGSVIELPQGFSTIGRDHKAVIRLDYDRSISRLHARLRVIGEDVTLEDMGSSFGTSVNGERLESSRHLCDGDEIVFGSTALKYRCASFSP